MRKILILILFTLLFSNCFFGQTTICEGEQLILETVNPNGQNVQWQYSLDMSNWFDILGAFSYNYAVTPSSNIFYRLKITDVNCSETMYTDQQYVQVIQSPNISAGNDISVCPNELVTLTAAGGVSYTWDNSVVNGQPFIPLQSGAYTVIGVDANGCANSDQVVISINPCVPNIVTTLVTSVTAATAESGGVISNDGGSNISSRGVCFSTSTGPTLANGFTVDGVGIGSYNSSLSNLQANTTYFVRAYATNSLGTFYGNELNFTTGSYQIGGPGPAGGLIFYDKGFFSSGWQFLEASPTDVTSAGEWGCNGFYFFGADNTSIGGGELNTTQIVANCTTLGIGAELCFNLSLGGFSDWFLPSKQELNQMYLNLYLNSLGNMAPAIYMTSNQTAPAAAWYQDFSSGTQVQFNKGTSSYYVRAIRAF